MTSTFFQRLLIIILLAGTIPTPVSYKKLRAHETVLDFVCRLLLEKKKKTKKKKKNNERKQSVRTFTGNVH